MLQPSFLSVLTNSPCFPKTLATRQFAPPYTAGRLYARRSAIVREKTAFIKALAVCHPTRAGAAALHRQDVCKTSNGSTEPAYGKNIRIRHVPSDSIRMLFSRPRSAGEVAYDVVPTPASVNALPAASSSASFDRLCCKREKASLAVTRSFALLFCACLDRAVPRTLSLAIASVSSRVLFSSVGDLDGPAAWSTIGKGCSDGVFDDAVGGGGAVGSSVCTGGSCDAGSSVDVDACMRGRIGCDQ